MNTIDMKKLIVGIDHAMIAVRDLKEAARNYSRLGFAVVVPGGRHIGRGTENTLMRFGWGWIELIAIHDPAERARLELPVDGLSDVLRDRQGGFVDVILTTHATDRLAERLSAAGIPVNEFSIQRVRPDGLTTKNRVTAPTAASIRHLCPSFIEWLQVDPERLSRDRQGVHANGAQEIVAISIVVNNLEAARAAYAQVLELPTSRKQSVSDIGADRIRCKAGSLTINLLAATGPGLVQSALAAIGEGLFEVHIRVKDIAQARIKLADLGVEPTPAPGAPGGYLLPEGLTIGARLVLVE